MRPVPSLLSAAALGLVISTANVQFASAEAPADTLLRQIQSGDVATGYAQYRRHGGRHYYGGRHYGRPYAGRYYRRDRGAAAAGLIGGLAAGAIIGGAIASQQAQAVPVAPADDAIAYCAQRFRSYDPASGTYLGYDGLRHPCP
jgi:hypothetical protein